MKKLIALLMMLTIPLSAMNKDIELGNSEKLQKIQQQQKKRNLCRDSAIAGIGLTVSTMGPVLVIGTIGTFVWVFSN